MGREFGRRLPALLALALPVLAGLVHLRLAGAPQNYLLVNAGSLVLGGLLIAFLQSPASSRRTHILAGILVAALFLPLVTGPSIGGAARWLPLGPFQLHSGSLLVPGILVLVARDEVAAPPVMLACVLAGLLQPDAALGFAVVFAAVALHDVTRAWHMGLVCILGFIASLLMAFRANPPPQQLVERVLVDAASISPALTAGLFLSLAASFFLILWAIPAARTVRYALAGSLFGFVILSVMNNYPSVFIGYGAAPILGYGLALGLACGTFDEAHKPADEEQEAG